MVSCLLPDTNTRKPSFDPLPSSRDMHFHIFGPPEEPPFAPTRQYTPPGLPAQRHIMWGSDYPHPDSTWPFSKEIIDKDSAHLSPEMKRNVTRDNAAALYRL